MSIHLGGVNQRTTIVQRISTPKGRRDERERDEMKGAGLEVWFRRRKADDAESSAMWQVDGLIADEPPSLEVPISALPGQHEELLKTFGRLFKLRGYELRGVEHLSAELWTATFKRGR
jgi:hypothetical protein